MSLNSFINTLQGIADTPEIDVQTKKYSFDEYIANAIACMMAGLPDDFYVAHVKYKKNVSESDSNEIHVSYTYIAKAGEDERLFDPADYLYPVSCIESILRFYPSDDTSWDSFTIEFTPNNYEAGYY